MTLVKFMSILKKAWLYQWTGFYMITVSGMKELNLESQMFFNW